MTITRKPKSAAAAAAAAPAVSAPIAPVAEPPVETPTVEAFLQAAEHSIPALSAAVEPPSLTEPISAKAVSAAAPQIIPDAVAEAALPPAADAGPEAGKKAKGKDKKKKKKDKEQKKKEAVLIRFDNSQLVRIDASASALGLSRAAWVRMVVAQALPPAP